MRRLLVGIVGLLLAFLAGCCFLATALLMEAVAAPTQTSLALYNVAALLIASVDGNLTGHLVGVGLMLVWLTLIAICLVPVTLVAVLGEAAGLRSLVWFAGGSGSVAAGMPTLLRAVTEGSPSVVPGAAEGRATLILFLTGLVGGCVYWLVAGRGRRAGGMR